MNWRLSALDKYTLVSHSDAHSPAKLGREADLFTCEMTYPAIKQALENKGAGGFGGTLEFFPEEGKYHADGHRNCGVCLTPEETERAGGLCPVCGKKVTVGVWHRAAQLLSLIHIWMSWTRTASRPLRRCIPACPPSPGRRPP